MMARQCVVAASLLVLGLGLSSCKAIFNNPLDPKNLSVSTLAGTGASGYAGDGGPAASANLSFPKGLALDASGNLYIADAGNHCIRRVDGATGTMGTVAGVGGISGFSGDGGLATAAALNNPLGVACDSSGNLYIADTGNNCVRRVDGATGIISTIAGMGGSPGFSGDGGPAAAACLSNPSGIALDSTGNLYIADSSNSCVRRVDAATQIIGTIAGTGTVSGYSGDGGPAASALLAYPSCLALDLSGKLYISDTCNGKIRIVHLGTGIITTQDNDIATAISVGNEMVVDASGFVYYTCSNAILALGSDGSFNTIAGSDIAGGFLLDYVDVKLNQAYGLAMDSSGCLYVADSGNNTVIRIGK